MKKPAKRKPTKSSKAGTTLLLLITLTLLLAASTHQKVQKSRRKLAEIKNTEEGSSKTLGKIIAIVVRTTQYILLLLALIDILCRGVLNHPLKLLGAFRFIIIAYAMCTPAFVGLLRPFNYRVYLNNIFTPFLAYQYNGFYNTGSIDILGDVKDSDGRTYPGYFNYANLLFLEILIFLSFFVTVKILYNMHQRGACFETTVSVEKAFSVFFLFPFFVVGILWFRQFFDLIGYNRDKEPNLSLFSFGYVVGWIVMLPIFLLNFWDSVVWLCEVVGVFLRAGKKRKETGERGLQGSPNKRLVASKASADKKKGKKGE